MEVKVKNSIDWLVRECGPYFAHPYDLDRLQEVCNALAEQTIILEEPELVDYCVSKGLTTEMAHKVMSMMKEAQSKRFATLGRIRKDSLLEIMNKGIANAKKLKSIEMQGLWKLYNLTWNLESDVNILSGSNGSGKSTILSIVAMLTSMGKLDKQYNLKAERVILTFDDGTKLVNINYDDTLQKLKEKSQDDKDYNDLWQNVTKDLKEQDEDLSLLTHMGIEASISFVEGKDGRIPIRSFVSDLNVDIVSTFDTPLSIDFEHLSLQELRKEGVYTTLDYDLKDLQEQYALFIGELASQVERIVSSGNPVDMSEVSMLYRRKNLFLNIVDEFFQDTGKRLDRTNGRLQFILEDGHSKVTVYDLSSGEKQVLLIMLKVLLQNEKDYIVFMDEPEISLHIDWQSDLIDKVRILNPNCQLIIASHAPSLILRGWQSRVKNLEDLKNK